MDRLIDQFSTVQLFTQSGPKPNEHNWLVDTDVQSVFGDKPVRINFFHYGRSTVFYCDYCGNGDDDDGFYSHSGSMLSRVHVIRFGSS